MSRVAQSGIVHIWKLARGIHRRCVWICIENAFFFFVLYCEIFRRRLYVPKRKNRLDDDVDVCVYYTDVHRAILELQKHNGSRLRWTAIFHHFCVQLSFVAYPAFDCYRHFHVITVVFEAKLVLWIIASRGFILSLENHEKFLVCITTNSVDLSITRKSPIPKQLGIRIIDPPFDSCDAKRKQKTSATPYIYVLAALPRKRQPKTHRLWRVRPSGHTDERLPKSCCALEESEHVSARASLSNAVVAARTPRESEPRLYAWRRWKQVCAHARHAINKTKPPVAGDSDRRVARSRAREREPLPPRGTMVTPRSVVVVLALTQV